MNTTTTSGGGRTRRDLRAERERAGLTRADLAARVDCSLAMLGNLEAGAIPKRSAVLERVYAVLAALNDERRVHQPGAVTISPEDTRRHDAG